MKDAQKEFGIRPDGGTLGWILALPFTFILVDWDKSSCGSNASIKQWLGTVLVRVDRRCALRELAGHLLWRCGVRCAGSV